MPLPSLQEMYRKRISISPERPSRPTLREKPSLKTKECTKRIKCTRPNCGKFFRNKNAYNSHVKYACNLAPRYKCGYCDYRSYRPHNVRRHERSKHKNREILIVDMNKILSVDYTCPNDCTKNGNLACYYCNFRSSFAKKKERMRKKF